MPYPGYTVEEVGRRGQTLYDAEIRPEVEAEHHGKFLVVDVTSGEYEVDNSDLAASNRAMTKNPNAVLYGVRIGYTQAYRFGVGVTEPLGQSPEKTS